MPDLVPDRDLGRRACRRPRWRSASRAPCRAPGRRSCCGSTGCRSRRPRRSRTRSSAGTSRSSCSSCRSSGSPSRWSTGSCSPRSRSPARATCSPRPRGGEVFVTRVRVHLAVIAGLYLLSIAFGYQLDKYELVYSTRGGRDGRRLRGRQRAVPRLRRADAAVRRRGRAARRRRVHRAGCGRWALIVIVWFSASLLLGRIYPEVDPAPDRRPQQYAQEAQYIANNISMTRLGVRARRLGPAARYRGTPPLTGRRSQRGGHVHERPPVGLPAAPDDARPAPDRPPVLRLLRRRHGPLPRSTATLRQVMLSGRELAIERNPTGDELGQPADHLHPRHRRSRWSPSTRSPPRASRGSGSATCRRSRAAAPRRSPSRGSTSASGRQPLRRRPRPPARVRLPARRRATRRRRRPTTSWTGTTGIPLDSTLNRLLFALRFRDLDLLISDQITADSQLLFHRTLARAARMIAPFLRYDKDPTSSSTTTGRLVYVQDAYTIERPLPARDLVRHLPSSATTSGLRRRPFNYIRNSVKITMDAYDGTMHFYVTDPTTRSSAPGRGLPDAVRADGRHAGGLLHAPPRPRGAVQRPDADLRAVPRHRPADVLQQAPTAGRCPTAQTNEQSLPSEAYYVVMRMPGEPKAEFLLLQPMIAAEPAEHDRVGGRPQRRARTTATSRVYRFPADTTIFGPAQIEARIDQDPIDQRPDHAVEPERQLASSAAT